TFLMTGLKLRQDLTDRMIGSEFYWTNGIPGQSSIQVAFTHGFNGLVTIREIDVRQYTTMLGAGTGDTIELGAGEFHLTIIHRNNFLHSALTKGLATEHDAALVVLNGASKNF